MSVSTDLLRAIAEREEVNPCPASSVYVGEWIEILVAIGPDHSAQIRMSIDDYMELTRRDGDPVITVNGDGLQPHLEAFMFKILESIQVRVKGE